MAKYKTGRYQDWGKFSKGFSYALRGAGYALSEKARLQMTLLAEEYLGETDAKWPHHSEGRSYFGDSIKILNGSKFGGDALHPWYTGQLHDSVAIRIAEGNKTVAIRYMPQSASGGPQHMSAADGMKVDNIIGAEWAVRAAANAARYSHFFSPGIQVQLVVGVPYAEKVNESGRHHGFFDALTDDLVVKFDDYDWSGFFNRNDITVDENGNVIKQKTRSRGIRKR